MPSNLIVAQMNMTRRSMVISTVGALGATWLPTAAVEPSTAASAGKAGALSDLVSLDDFERAARKVAARAYENIASGAGDEITIRWNREDYNKLKLRPRVLVDVESLIPAWSCSDKSQIFLSFWRRRRCIDWLTPKERWRQPAALGRPTRHSLLVVSARAEWRTLPTWTVNPCGFSCMV